MKKQIMLFGLILSFVSNGLWGMVQDPEVIKRRDKEYLAKAIPELKDLIDQTQGDVKAIKEAKAFFARIHGEDSTVQKGTLERIAQNLALDSVDLDELSNSLNFIFTHNRYPDLLRSENIPGTQEVMDFYSEHPDIVNEKNQIISVAQTIIDSWEDDVEFLKGLLLSLKDNHPFVASALPSAVSTQPSSPPSQTDSQFTRGLKIGEAVGLALQRVLPFQRSPSKAKRRISHVVKKHDLKLKELSTVQRNMLAVAWVGNLRILRYYINNVGVETLFTIPQLWEVVAELYYRKPVDEQEVSALRDMISGG